MSNQLVNFANHKNVNNTLKFLSYSVSRDKIYRTFQYAARILAWFYAKYGIPQGTFLGVDLDAIKSTLSNARKLLRVGKPLEHIQNTIKAFNNESPTTDIIVKILNISKQINYTLFLSLDAIIWIHSTNIRKLSNSRFQTVQKFFYRFWALGLLSGVFSGIYKEQMLSRSLTKARRQALTNDEKANSNVNRINVERHKSRRELLEDGLNILIPISGLQLANINEGIVGSAGLITSLMGLCSQWSSITATADINKSK